MTSGRPYWCPKNMKRWPCWCPKPVLWELNSFLMQTHLFLCSDKFAHMQATWVKTLYKNDSYFLLHYKGFAPRGSFWRWEFSVLFRSRTNAHHKSYSDVVKPQFHRQMNNILIFYIFIIKSKNSNTFQDFYLELGFFSKFHILFVKVHSSLSTRLSTFH